MLTDMRVLVVEADFLVALEIQRVLEHAHAADSAFARSIAEAAALEPRFGAFDLAIIQMEPGDTEASALASVLMSSGVAVVGTMSESTAIQPAPLPRGIPLVNKPFDPTELLTACAIALAAPPQLRRTGRASFT